MVTALGRVTETPGKLRRAGGKIPACPGDSIQVLSPWDCAWRRQQEAVPWFGTALVAFWALPSLPAQEGKIYPKSCRVGSDQCLE